MAFLDRIDEEIRRELYRAAETVRKYRKVQLFSHYDADGVTSMAIVRTALEREGIETVRKNYPTLTDSQMADVASTEFDCMVMTDLGTSYLSQISALGRDCIVLDHHALPKNMPNVDDIVFVNPWTVGVNGSEHSCAATVALLFALALNEDNFDLCQIAICGMIGDYQHRTGFDQYNRMVVQEAMARGYISSMRSVCPIGNIADFLYKTIDPYCKGLTGNREAVMKVLEGLPENLEFGDTELAERIGSIVDGNLRSNGVTEEEIDAVLRTRYYLRDFRMDAGYLSDILDACGRSDNAEIALEIIASRDVSKGVRFFDEFRNGILAQYKELENGGVIQMEHIQYFIHHTPSSGGIIGTSVLKFFGCNDKPIIALMDMGDFVNLSSRSNQRILDMGVSMNLVLTAIQDRHGATCGGHPKASGGTLRPGTVDAFLKDLDEEVGRAKTKNKA